MGRNRGSLSLKPEFEEVSDQSIRFGTFRNVGSALLKTWRIQK